ncbi:MAG: 1-acyl-sn-glycerol-3-phosphate acyltransferase [Elusimicrobia bacterium]|nr:1-acyl-sn-glycerol-3-phosphate acyltransferase [Elusimicrobiota bacterium]
MFRLKVTGRENLPAGGYIIASNHNSYFDPPLVGVCNVKGVYFMAKKELFYVPVLGTAIRKTHAFPVDRENPGPSSIKRAIGLLRSGKVLLIFPEGTRKSSHKIHSGVSMLSHKSGVPVVPSRIYNNDRMKSFARLKYVIGKPVYFPFLPGEKAPEGEYESFAEAVMSKIERL